MHCLLQSAVCCVLGVQSGFGVTQTVKRVECFPATPAERVSDESASA